MTERLTAKQEAFCLAYVRGKSATEAFLTAYDWHGSRQGAQRHASRLAAKPKIHARIEALRERAARRVEIDKAWVLQELITVYETAMGRDEAADTEDESESQSTRKSPLNLAAANRALELIGTELGMFVRRRIHAFKPIDQMNEAEIVDVLGEEPDEAVLDAVGKLLAGDIDPDGVRALTRAEPTPTP
jgi:hypothetical protein